MRSAHRFPIVGEGLQDYEVHIDPDEAVDCGFDWSRHLRGDPIATSSWAFPAGVSSNPAGNFANERTTIWPDGLTAGADYQLTNTVTTEGGRTYRRTLRVRCYD